MVIFHGSGKIVKSPEIRIGKYHKDFYYGFYCTLYRGQAERWATRFTGNGYVNEYELGSVEGLKYLKFDGMTEEWLDFVVDCRLGNRHQYDIVEGPMANDTIFNFVQDFVDGKITRSALWELAKFKKPTHQISFHTASALETLHFIRGVEVHGKE